MVKTNYVEADKILDRLKIELGFRQDSELADYFGVTRAAVSLWRSRNSVPPDVKIHILDKFKSVFENSPDKYKLPDDAVVRGAEKRFIPVIGLASAGADLFTDPEFTEPDELMSCPAGLKDPQAFWIPVVGDSMTPFVRNGSRICVSPNVEPKSTDRCVLGLTNGSRIIAEIRYGADGDTIRLVKYNSEEHTISKAELEFCYKIVYVKEM